MSLNKIKARLKVVIGQIDNEKLTGDCYVDYKIRYQTGELCAERNRLKQQAFNDFSVVL